jgi:hypothetical protein
MPITGSGKGTELSLVTDPAADTTPLRVRERRVAGEARLQLHVVHAEGAGQLEIRLAQERVLVRQLVDPELRLGLDQAARLERVVAPLDVAVDGARARRRVVEVEEAEMMGRRDPPQQIGADSRGVVAVAERPVEIDVGVRGRRPVEPGRGVGADDEPAETADEGVVQQPLRRRHLRVGWRHRSGEQQRGHGSAAPSP